MENFPRGLGLIGLLVVAVLVALLVMRSARTSSQERRRELDAITDEQPPPPADVARSPRVAKQHVKESMCLGDCEGAARTCRALAEAESGKASCQKELDTCIAACP
jgi:hypothetical protein